MNGHPDEVPLRSDEFHLLARALHRLSARINALVPFDRHYEEKSLAGCLARQVCRPPCRYRERGQLGETVRLPARLALRPLARHAVLAYAGLLLASVWLLGGARVAKVALLAFTAWMVRLFYLVLAGEGKEKTS